MKKLLTAIVTIATLCLFSCADPGRYQPNVSGAAFEVLLVIDNDVYRSEAGEAIFNVLADEVPHIPQYEPQFKISRIEQCIFDNLLKTTRNIVFVSIDSAKFTSAKINLKRNTWAKTQAIVQITSPDCQQAASAIIANAQAIQDFIIKAERERMTAYYKANINSEGLNLIMKQFGCKVVLPSSLNKYKQGDNFFWASNCSNTARQDFIIYSVPYTSKSQLTEESILARRDSVLKANLNGSIEGSYMGTEYRIEPPEVKKISLRKKWAAETRGLWRMIDGQCMGGPFVSITRVDEVYGKIITVEGFVFAPSKDKRNLIRQMDAVVYSLLLPDEINEIEIQVKNK